jgi:hypothetical protein
MHESFQCSDVTALCYFEQMLFDWLSLGQNKLAYVNYPID